MGTGQRGWTCSGAAAARGSSRLASIINIKIAIGLMGAYLPVLSARWVGQVALWWVASYRVAAAGGAASVDASPSRRDWAEPAPLRRPLRLA